MRIRHIVTGVAATLLSIGPVTVAAQGPSDTGSRGRHTRDGFWIGFGMGAGSLGRDECDCDRETSWSGNFKLGGTISPRFLLGLETNGWIKSEDIVTMTYGNLSAVAYFYPSVTSGFHVKGGVGFAMLEVDASEFGNATETGGGGVVGLGYDVRVGKMFSITPFTNLLVGSFNEGSANLFQLGLGLTWH